MAYLVVPQHRGPAKHPPDIEVLLIIGAPKMVPRVLGTAPNFYPKA